MKKILLSVVLISTIANADILRVNERDIVLDTQTKLMWQDDIKVKTVKKTWEDSKKYCQNLKFAGFNDWRLPTETELLSITTRTKENPTIKNEFKYVADDLYWSSSENPYNYASVWGVIFIDGFGNTGVGSQGSREMPSYIRCVRNNK